MSGTKGVMDALGSFREAADAAEFPVGMEHIPSACKDFVPIGLVTHIPYDLVAGGIEDIMQRHGKFNDPEAGTQVPRIRRYHVDDELPEFIAEQDEFFGIKVFDVRWSGNTFQDRILT